MTVRQKVLVADDEPQMAMIVSYALQTQGFDTVVAHDGLEAKALLATEHPDAAVLDVMMPRMDGLDLCRYIRGTSGIPVILLTARSEHEHLVEGFETGADDYVSKPFHPRELALRVAAVLRRRPAVQSQTISVGHLRIDVSAHELTVDGLPVPVSGTEFRLLVALASRPGVLVTWQDLLREAWHVDEWAGGREMVKAAVYRLRQRLGDDPTAPRYIHTVRGVGYRLVTAPPGVSPDAPEEL